jgi:hypothetical protein
MRGHACPFCLSDHTSTTRSFAYVRCLSCGKGGHVSKWWYDQAPIHNSPLKMDHSRPDDVYALKPAKWQKIWGIR